MPEPYSYIRFNWWDVQELQNVAASLNDKFKVEWVKKTWDDREVSLSDNINEELKIKADTLGAYASATRVVMYQREYAPFTRKDMELREKLMELYPRDRPSPLPFMVGIEPRFEVGTRAELEENAVFCSYSGTRIETTQPPKQEPMIQEAKPRGTQRLRAIELAGISLIIILSAAIIVHQMTPNALSTQPTQTLTSSYWSGYSVSTSLKNPQPMVTNVSASWTVPVVHPTPGFSYSAAWIGVGGQFDQTLIQVGTQHDSINGVVSYSAWYELLPDLLVTITNVPIKAGDSIEATITQTNSITNTWSINFIDLTTGQSNQTSVIYQSLMLSAEWIVEWPTILNHPGTLANFSSVTFTDCKATVGGKTGRIIDFPSSQFNLTNHLNVQLISLSSIRQDGSSFTASYIQPNW